ncbi:hypothetical protein DICVIV_10007 [Dictyocaulus viviparus]|uniref:Uncharacterized protein n=1 Tax=Dictyocaulus viviparus TaxID=29172 RepID=A0A0D8XH79_DICVI|nr:hypothetical protein DICVIV_10007 [Dictyocaulus viviparus]
MYGAVLHKRLTDTSTFCARCNTCVEGLTTSTHAVANWKYQLRFYTGFTETALYTAPHSSDLEEYASKARHKCTGHRMRREHVDGQNGI